MHKEPTTFGNGSVVEKNVFDEEDIKFIEGDGAYLTQDELAAYFKISLRNFYDITRRQANVLAGYEKAKTLKKLSYHKLADDMTHGKAEGNTTLLIFQLKTRCRMSEAASEVLTTNEPIETPEEKAARMEKIKLYTEFTECKNEFTEWKNQRNNLGSNYEKK